MITEAQFSEIIEKIEGGSGLVVACSGKCAPSWFLTLCDRNPEWKERYVRARIVRAEVMEQSLLEIVDEKPPLTENGSTDSGYVQDKRLRMDARKWLMAKMAPRQYGEKVQVSGDSDAPLQIQQVTRVVLGASGAIPIQDQPTNKQLPIPEA